jgi:glutathione S-transferase
MTVTVFEHPLSPYAQKVKIALDEKHIAYTAKMPAAIGTGHIDQEFMKANPRGEVPALIDGDVAIFDSTIILEYLEDRWPNPPLLPKDPAARARARTIEDVMDTAFEPINWGMGEIRWFKRAEGAKAQALEARAAAQARGLYDWLARALGHHQWFGGEQFGWADLSVVPYLNGAHGLGIGPHANSALGHWLARANGRDSVKKAALAATESVKVMSTVATAVKERLFKREYRDHRLEWMIRSGGLDVVIEGLKSETIRFSNELS